MRNERKGRSGRRVGSVGRLWREDGWMEWIMIPDVSIDIGSAVLDLIRFAAGGMYLW